MTSYPDGFDVEGPVQAEVFVVWLAGDHLALGRIDAGTNEAG